MMKNREMERFQPTFPFTRVSCLALIFDPQPGEGKQGR